MIPLPEGGPLTKERALQYNPLQLAYIGDTVYDLFIRANLVMGSDKNVRLLHRDACALVNCAAQADALASIEEGLSDDELDIVRRGRNAHARPPRNADPAKYSRATGLEALFGYLYLTGQTERLHQIMRQIMQTKEL